MWLTNSTSKLALSTRSFLALFSRLLALKPQIAVKADSKERNASQKVLIVSSSKLSVKLSSQISLSASSGLFQWLISPWNPFSVSLSRSSLSLSSGIWESLALISECWLSLSFEDVFRGLDFADSSIFKVSPGSKARPSSDLLGEDWLSVTEGSLLAELFSVTLLLLVFPALLRLVLAVLWWEFRPKKPLGLASSDFSSAILCWSYQELASSSLSLLLANHSLASASLSLLCRMLKSSPMSSETASETTSDTYMKSHVIFSCLDLIQLTYMKFFLPASTSMNFKVMLWFMYWSIYSDKRNVAIMHILYSLHLWDIFSPFVSTMTNFGEPNW